MLQICGEVERDVPGMSAKVEAVEMDRSTDCTRRVEQRLVIELDR